MSGEQGPGSTRFQTVRDWALLCLGGGMLIVETTAAIFGRPADYVIVGAALAVLGIVPVLQERRS